MTGPALLTVRDGAVATVTLNRPEVHNAFNDAVIAELTAVFRGLGEDPAVRFVVLRANGKNFCSGGDLNWMRRMAGNSREENLADARALAAMLQTLNTLPKPTLALVHGQAHGGGVGLIACCDIAIAADSAVFSLAEVKVGLLPAVVAPFVVQAIGARAARRYFLTAERFSAIEAHRLGLVHEVVPGHLLDAAGRTMLERLAEGGPQAQAAAKDFIFTVAGRPVAATVDEAAQRIADIRATAEGREGVSAFLEKRPPNWRSWRWGPG